ncbi:MULTISPECIES: oligosaccharide flippase family protein [Streptococcus]|uniref:Oligosaccharide flippase family protein n=1 Tax=Streptococcus caledonicus TaxID=2614158 RepID=A0ABW0UC50_9STRE|nr:oligosaccharide flippase family protein [Streptococcus sp. S784/96/1]
MKSSKKNFIYQAIYQVLVLLIPLVTTPYLTRTLGVKALGEYSYSYSIIYYFMMLIKLGLDNYGNRQIAKVRDDKYNLSKSFFSIYIFQFGMGIIVSIFYFSVIFFLIKNITLNIIMFIYILSSMFDINWFFYGLEEFKALVLRNIVIRIFITILIFALINGSDDLLKYAVIMALGTFVNQIYLWAFIKKKINIIKINKSDIVSHIKPNIILFIPVVAISIYKIMDKIMLGLLTNTEQVGFFDSSEKVIQIPMALVTALGMVMLPKMSNLYAKKESKSSERLIGLSLELVLFLTTSLGFGLMAVSKTFVPWYYGEGFEIVIILFQILLPSGIFLGIANVIRTQYLIPKGMDNFYIFSLILGAVANLTINSILIPKLGVIGVAIGTFCAELVVCAIQLFFVRKYLPLKSYFNVSLKYFVSGFLMYILVLNLNFTSISTVLNLGLQIFIGALIYLVCLFLFSTKKNRNKLFKTFFKR